MPIKTDDGRSVWVFFALTYLFTWALWLPCIPAVWGAASPTARHEFLREFLTGPFNPAAYGPLVSASLLTFLQEGGRGVLQLWKRGVDVRFPKIWLPVAVLLPSALFGGSVWTAMLIGLRPVESSPLLNPPYAVTAFGVILLTAGPLQEEFGWRGYALPRLQARFSAVTSSLIVGFFWWLWHLPAVFIPGKFMTNDLVVFLALLPVVVSASVLFTWIYNNTNGSLLATLLAHTSMNWSIWSAMPGMHLDLPTSGCMAGLPAVAVLVIVKIWGATHLRRQPEHALVGAA